MFAWYQKEKVLRRSERFAKRGDFSAALAELNSAVARHPNDLGLIIQKIWLLIENEKFEEAHSVLESGLELSPEHPVLWMLLGESKYKNRQYAEAKDCFIRSLEYGPDNLRAEYNLGLSYLALGDHLKASQFFESSIKYDKNLVQARMLAMAETYLRKAELNA